MHFSSFSHPAWTSDASDICEGFKSFKVGLNKENWYLLQSTRFLHFNKNLMMTVNCLLANTKCIHVLS